MYAQNNNVRRYKGAKSVTVYLHTDCVTRANATHGAESFVRPFIFFRCTDSLVTGHTTVELIGGILKLKISQGIKVAGLLAFYPKVFKLNNRTFTRAFEKAR